MAGMGYPSTLAILSHALHAHVERCMKTEDVAYQMMKNDLDRAMKNWRCTMKRRTMYGSEWLCATICSSLRHGGKMTRSLFRAYLMSRPQDTCAYSGNDWRSSWEGQHSMQGPRGQTFSDINDNSYGREKRFGNNTGNVYGTRVTRR